MRWLDRLLAPIDDVCSYRVNRERYEAEWRARWLAHKQGVPYGDDPWPAPDPALLNYMHPYLNQMHREFMRQLEREEA